MPSRFAALATYNAERARGIVHTPEWDAQMAALQAEFDQWNTREITRNQPTGGTAAWWHPAPGEKPYPGKG